MLSHVFTLLGTVGLLFFYGCSGEDEASGSVSLSYAAISETFTVGTAITPLVPQTTGTTFGFTISPALPSGLSLETTSGVISGTPTVSRSSAEYTVTLAGPAAKTVTTTLTFAVRTGNGKLTFQGKYTNGVDGISGLDGVRYLTISRDGKFLYASGAGGAGSLTAFSRDAATGALAQIQSLTDNAGGVDGLGGIHRTRISPDGAHLYAVGATENKLAVFSRDGSAGTLAFIEVHTDGASGVDGLMGANDIVVSPSGDFVYVVAQSDNKISIFSRSASTGRLTFVAVDANAGLTAPYAMAMTANGAFAYVTASDNLVLYSRNTTTGLLTHVQTLTDGAGGINVMQDASTPVLSSDDSVLYVPGATDGGIVVFSRHSTTGLLTVVQELTDGVSGISGLNYVIDLVLSPANDSLYTAALNANRVGTFSRVSAGSLTFIETVADGVNGVDGLQAPQSIAISPDGSYVYVGGFLDDKVAYFSR